MKEITIGKIKFSKIPRLCHLAMCGKNRRIRKKNKKKMMALLSYSVEEFIRVFGKNYLEEQ